MQTMLPACCTFAATHICVPYSLDTINETRSLSVTCSIRRFTSGVSKPPGSKYHHEMKMIRSIGLTVLPLLFVLTNDGERTVIEGRSQKNIVHKV